jgi:outer membrane protein assembly factor BamB
MPKHLCCLLWLFSAPILMAQSSDWTTWGHDPERTGWNQEETTLTKENVGSLGLAWSVQLSTPAKEVVLSTLTAPVVVAAGKKSLLFVLSADDTIFALDADTGATLWRKSYPNVDQPLYGATWLCSNTANDTPVIDKQRGLIFFLASDGKLRGLNMLDGAERMAPTTMVEPYARAWSLNLIDNIVYTSGGRGCGQQQKGEKQTTVPGSVSAMDVSDLAHPQLTRFYTSSNKYSGPWGRGGVSRGPHNNIFAQTADGLYDPASGNFGNTLLMLAPHAARLLDSFTPANWQYLNQQDLDFGSSSASVFPLEDRTLVAVGGKEGVLYLLNAADLGGGPPSHSTPLFQSPQLANDDAQGKTPGQGIWGALPTYLTPAGKRFLYVPIWGPPSKHAPAFPGSAAEPKHGSIMAFTVVPDGKKITLQPQWISPDMQVPDPPVIANGILFAMQTGEQTIQSPSFVHGTQPEINKNPLTAKYRATPVSHLILYAFNAETGQQLYSSGGQIPGWVHFSEPVVAAGKVFVVTHDAHVYAFGVKHAH